MEKAREKEKAAYEKIEHYGFAGDVRDQVHFSSDQTTSIIKEQTDFGIQKQSHSGTEEQVNSGVGKVATIMSMIPIMRKTAWAACKEEEIEMQSIEINRENEKN